MRRKIASWSMLLLLLVSCRGNGVLSETSEGDTLQLHYAQHLQIVEHEGYTEAVLLNPWQAGRVLHRYYMVPKSEDSEEVSKLLEKRMDGDIVRTPVKRSVIFTAPHCQLLYELACEDAIKGVCDMQYIHARQFDRSRVVDCGQAMQPMIEKIIDLHPEALLASPYENSGGYGKLEHLGVPVIEAADYMETSPLGRAEWMKFYGRLFGCEQRADSLFHAVDSAYQTLCEKASKMPQGRSILTERKTGNVWYTPGGQSTIGRMLADAHAAYPWAEDKHAGSLALSVEQVVDRGEKIDVWAFKYIAPKPLTREDLLQEYAGYGQLKAFRNGEVYECNTDVEAFFDETGFHPDYLLRDFIILAHPEAGLGGLRYYKKIEP